MGLVVPGATGIAPALTPVAALCLVVLMAGAIATHGRLGERFLPAVIVGALCLLVGLTRLRVGQERSARTENRILEAALRVFAERGPGAPIIDDFDFVKAAAGSPGGSSTTTSRTSRNCSRRLRPGRPELLRIDR